MTRNQLLSSLVIASVFVAVATSSTTAASAAESALLQTPTNQPPVATPQSVTTAENTAVGIALTGTDPDGDPLTFTITGWPASGTLAGSGANWAYMPNTGFSGADSFTFTVDDGSLTSNPATVSITVTPGLFVKSYTRSGAEAAHSVAQAQGGGYVFAGETTTPGMGKDVWVVKVDAAGQVVWQYAYGGPGDEGTAQAYGVAPDLNRVRVIATSDGGYAVAATTTSFSAGWNGWHDAWVLKLDAAGGIMWQFAYGGPFSEAAADIVEIPGGWGYAVAGSAQSYTGSGYDAWILRIDPNGNQLWQTTYGLWGDEYAMSLTATPWGGLAVTGSTYSLGADPWLWVMLLDPSLNLIWNHFYAATGFNAGNSIIQTSDGNFAVTGTIGGEPGVLKLEPFSGYVMWQSTFGSGAGYEGEGRSIVQTADGGYAVAGATTGNGGDAWVLKLDAAGGLVWQKSFGGTGIDRASGILQTADGGYAVAGETRSFGPGAALLLRLDTNGDAPSCVPLTNPSSLPAVTVATTEFPYYPPVGWAYSWYFPTSAGATSTTATTLRECPNSTPVAHAGANQSLFVGDPVQLDGSASSDADGDPLTYAWSLTPPAGSAAALSSTTAVNPTFIADVAGTYVAELVVSDAVSTSPPDSATISAVVPALQLAPSTANLLTFESATLTATSPKAGALSVTLTSSDAAIASAPPNTTTPPGDFKVTAGTKAGTATITASGSPPFTPATSQVTVALRTMSLSTPGPLVGLNKTLPGTITLDQAAPAPSGITINLTTSPPGIVDVTPASVLIGQGSTSGSFTISGLAVGNATITASALGFAPATLPLNVTATSLITLGQGLVVAPGQSSGLALSLGAPPANGLPINLTSSDTGVATVTSPVPIGAGQYIPAANPVVTGKAFGTTQITASANGYAPDVVQVQVTVTLGLNPDPLTVIQGATGDITLNVSAPAPAGGFTFNVTTANANVATAPASVKVQQGTTSEKITVTGVSVGTTTLQVGAPGVAAVTATINVDPKPAITVDDATVGKDLQVPLSGSLAAPAPAGNLQVKITSGDPNRLLLSTSATTPGPSNGVITLQVNAGSTDIPTFYVQALDGAGSVQITTFATGYNTDTSTISLLPSAFIINDPSSISTNSQAANTSIQIVAARLPATPTSNDIQSLRGGLTVGVPVTSSNSSVGTITVSPVVFNANASLVTTEFDPQSAGVATISLGTPAGFSTPATGQQITATVTAPPISVGDATVGKDLQTALQNGSLDAPAPAGNLQVTITSGDPNRLLLSTSPTVAGPSNGIITVQVNAGDYLIPDFYLQALDGTGTVQITTKAPGYADDTSTITLRPSGFRTWSPGSISTSSRAANTSIAIVPVFLSSTFAPQGEQPLRAGFTASVPVTSSNSSVGTITVSPVVFKGNDGVVTTEFDPQSAGVTTISLGTPAGFSTPTNYQQITATVTAPAINVGDTTVGKDLQTALQNGSLDAPAPAGNLQVTITSGDPARLLLSKSATTVGPSNGTITLQVNAGDSVIPDFYLQALGGTGTVQITTKAPGYADDTSTITLQPSGFIIDAITLPTGVIINSPNSLSTTTFAANTWIHVASALLDPSTLALQDRQPLRAGSTASVSVSSSNTGVGIITVSPVVFNGNDGSVAAEFDPLAGGTTTITLGTPAGFSTPGQSQQLTATVTAPAITVGAVAVGLDLQVPLDISLPEVPPSPVTVTVTSNSSAIATITTNATVAGGTTLTFPNVSGKSVGTIYVQGRGLGSTTLTLQAPGYTDGTPGATVDPSGFIIRNPPSVSTTTFSANTPLYILPARLDPTTLNYQEYPYQGLRGGLSVGVPVTSSMTGVGTITVSPLVLNGGDTSATTEFDPQNAGTTTISIGIPAGFSTPSNFQQLTATVTAPAITVSATALGLDLQAPLDIYLPEVPPSPVTVTVTVASNNGAIATITTNDKVAGGTTLMFPNVSGKSVGTIYVQGRGLGSTTLTLQAPGYTDGTGNVTVDPSGFIIYAGNISTTTFSANTTVPITPARLHPTTLNWQEVQALRGGLSASVAVTSSNPTAGPITASQLTFNGGDTSVTTEFDPQNAGTTMINIGTPAGFSTPSNFQQITATVSAPAIIVSPVRVGRDLQAVLDVYLPVAPPSPVTVTVTSNGAATATITTTQTAAGGTTLPFNGVSGTFVGSLYVQGRALGSTTLTVQATGYTDGTSQVTVDPSGFVTTNPGNFSTTASSPNTTIPITPARLHPTTLNWQETQALRGGLSVSVAVTSSEPLVGTITTSPVTFNGGDFSADTAFAPVAAGPATITVGTPAGFATSSNYRTITATVTP